MSTTSICIDGLSGYRDIKVLFERLSFRIDPGSVWQIAGPNGVGKTTFLRILAGLYDDYQGQVSASENINFRHDMLYIGHKTGVKQRLTPRENLTWLLQIAGRNVQPATIASALATVGLYGYEDILGIELSAGQQRRVALAQLFCTQASLWVLDEPFTAIDCAGVTLLERKMAEHLERGGKVVVSSHQPLSETLSVNVIDLQDFRPAEIFRGENDV